MDATDRAVAATLAYYGAFALPLSSTEVAQRLVPPARLGGSGQPVTIGDVVARLDALAIRGVIARRDGMYGPAELPGRAWEGRVEREKETAQKWRRMRRRAWWLQAVPFVRALLASGSLAMGTAGPDSDWDVLVVTRAGRLYTARSFLLAAAWTMGRLRTKRHSVAPDRFCFNHYLTDDALALRHRGIFTAHALSNIVAIHDPHGCLTALRAANGWTAEYIAMPGPIAAVHRDVPRSRALDVVRRTLELLLRTPLGGMLELALRRWQQERIAREPATHAAGGRVVADDTELEFHPHSLETAILERYNRALVALGAGRFAEADSGLTK